MITIMKKNEIIELNRDSFLKIDQYSNLQKSMEVINKDLYEYIDEIDDNTDPFANELSNELLESEANKKIETLHKVIERAFWIWLYPEHKLSISQVKEILNPYYDDEKKFQWLSEKYGECLELCVKIRNDYNEQQKNLKAQANKKK